jgi:effector-binding domain-containing protein
MSLQVRVGDLDPIPLAVVRRRAKPAELGTVVPESCGVVWDFVRFRGLAAGRNVAVYLNAEIALEVGVEIATAFEENGEVFRSATPGGLAASTTYFGPYQRLGLAYEAIREWCDRNGYRLSGASWEIYGHWQSEWNTDPSKIRTDVYQQVVAIGDSVPAGGPPRPKSAEYISA